MPMFHNLDVRGEALHPWLSLAIDLLDHAFEVRLDNGQVQSPDTGW